MVDPIPFIGHGGSHTLGGLHAHGGTLAHGESLAHGGSLVLLDCDLMQLELIYPATQNTLIRTVYTQVTLI